ncbi:hypothetical protein LX32DRAFT_690724 [Colletotrichum zoysiae]|uniref:Uncharacterized protein n=1 Tax=Colletotrichum zoysiae TaxID=1216348 RepID=A0AAD9HQQ8_9PEZI|nr:hypothetical protein LX32DRAFT_690724 [Colletotrichum zoysiae]
MAEDKRLHPEKKTSKPDEEDGKSDNSPPKNKAGGSRRARKKRQMNSSGNPILEKGSYRARFVSPVSEAFFTEVRGDLWFVSQTIRKHFKKFDAIRKDQKAEFKKFGAVEPKALTARAPRDTSIPVFGASSPPRSSSQGYTEDNTPQPGAQKRRRLNPGSGGISSARETCFTVTKQKDAVMTLIKMAVGSNEALVLCFGPLLDQLIQLARDEA